MKFLKDGQVIASGLLVRARKPGLQCLFPSAFKEKFQFLFDSDARVFSVLFDFGSSKLNLVNVYGSQGLFSKFTSVFFVS